MISSKKPSKQDDHDSGNGWYAKMENWDGQPPDWVDQLTPAEKRQMEDEVKYSIRASREGLLGPIRIGVMDD